MTDYKYGYRQDRWNDDEPEGGVIDLFIGVIGILAVFAVFGVAWQVLPGPTVDEILEIEPPAKVHSPFRYHIETFVEVEK